MKHTTLDDTIVALASGQGRAGVAVIRASGPRAFPDIERLAGASPPQRVAGLRTLRHPDTGEVLDQVLVLRFGAPRSFTGEDVVEIHAHGGPATVAAVVQALAILPGWRLARAGEFTRRAVANGKMDLAAAEGLADLVAAETAGQRRQALNQAGGALEVATRRWRDHLLHTLALLEAEIDFPDEGDVPVLVQQVRARAQDLAQQVRTALEDGRRGERLREGAVVVIAGPPNAGKSTLLNRLTGREVAIVTPVPGTTRDALEVRLDLDGLPVLLVDTAGLREARDAVERIGIERALARAQGADHVLWLSPADAPAGPPALPGSVTLVMTKADLGGPAGAALSLSAATGAGMPALLDHLTRVARSVLEGGETALVTRLRHREELGRALVALQRVVTAPEHAGIELLAEDLRLALRAIGRLTGAVDIDEIYDLVFREFCIGK